MYNCIICGHSTKKVLIPVNTCVAPMGNKLVNFSLLKCKLCGHLQKKIDKNWLKGIKNLYEKKYIFLGKHITLKNNKVFNRNDLIIKFLKKQFKFKNKGDFLDVGCGAGYFLESFQRLLKKWNVYAHDLTRLNYKIISKMKIKKFYVGDVENIKKKFDLITLNHVVEHLTNPRKVLRDVYNILNDNGMVIIRLPNIKVVHTDLTILDHCSHFSETSLINLLKISNFKVINSFKKINPTELFVVAVKNKNKEKVKIIKSKVTKKDIINLIWPKKILQKIMRDRSKKKIGVFGVGTSSFYLYACLKDKIDFFVDEDPAKIGRKYYNKEIYNIDNLPKNSNVYVGIHNSKFAKKIVKRLASNCPSSSFYTI
tara:strand:- start:5015 stop:6118 length:1104 start_codon:yes stop_codon:yes gene_type:complete